MATSQPRQDQVYLFRLQTLIIDGSTTVIRNIFDQKRPNVPLNVFLRQEKTAIKTLRTRNTITSAQFHLLYPKGGNPQSGKPLQPSITDIDLTLATCLLRNLNSFGLNPQYNWSATPQPGDTSLEADLCRLRNTRNEISHIASTAGINQATFQKKWTEIEQVLLRLNTSVPNPVQNLQQNIDGYMNNPLDPKAEEKIDEEINKLQKLEEDLDMEMQIVKYQFEDVKGNIEKVKEDVGDVKGNVEKVTEDIGDVKGNIEKVKEDIGDVKGNVEKVKEDVGDVKGNVEKVKEDVGDVKGNVEKVKEDVGDVKGNVEKVKEDVGDVKGNVEKVKEDIGDVKGNIEKVKEDVGDVKGNVEKVKEDVGDVKGNVEKVKEDVGDVKEDIAAAHKKIDEELKNQRKKAEPSIFRRLQEKIQMRGKKKKLKDDLITFYKDRHSTIPLSPLFEEQDTPLVDFYVLPQMKEVQNAFSRGEEIKTPVESLSAVFKKGSDRNHEIYLTADAGFGKTAFSKYLAVTWSQAHRPDDKYTKYFSKDAINAMREYEFLFLVLLRDSSDDCSIDDLIVNQIVQNLSRSYSMTISSLQEILHSERCLVILDGLDEWTHTEKKCSKVPKTIPHRNARAKCTVLTTTRPWKFSVISLNASQVDKKVELVKLTSESAQTLKEKAILKIKDQDIGEAKNLAESLNENVKKNRLDNLESVPLLLMYLICLWCDGVPLGKSKCELYTSIIELLLSRTMSKHPEMEPTCEPSQSDIPQCFSDQVQCKKHCTFLKALGKLASKTLMNKKKEVTLVFDQSVAEKYLSPDHLKLSLLSGIVTQSKQVKLTKQSSKVSFSHKSVQEYFCALYMSCQNENDVKKIVFQNCSSVQNILDMSAVFVFISGMNAKMISSISRELMPVISEDKITRTYRSRTHYDYKYVDPVKDIQNMYISCLKENPGNNDLKLRCQDFIINEECREESHFTNVKQLAIHNKNNMQSILIENEGICSLHEIIESCRMADLSNIRKIYYMGECKEEEVCQLLGNRSVECVTVISREWQDDHFIVKLCSCSSELCKTFQNNSLLQAIYIECFQMEHQVLEQFVNYIVDRKSMAEITLWNLDCISHDDSCPGFNLDFTQHSHLSTLGLAEVPVQELEVNVTQLVDCNVGPLSKPGIVTSLLRALPAASKLQKFVCSSLESAGEIEVMLETLPKLVTVKDVRLVGMNLGERSLSLSPEMLNIEYVVLWKVTMAARTLRDVVSLLQKLPQTVRVDMRGCKIRPETEFEQVKQFIQTSHNFRVTGDGITQYNQYVFVFETIKS